MARPVSTGHIVEGQLRLDRYWTICTLCFFAKVTFLPQMDPNHKATNRITCPVCAMQYDGCESCRFFATEFCAYGLPDPRSSQAHDNVGFGRDNGSTGSGIISLDQQAVGFKASEVQLRWIDRRTQSHLENRLMIHLV